MIGHVVSPSEDERETELSSITAIFPEAVIDPEDPFSVSIEIPVISEKPIPVASLQVPDGSSASALPTPPTSDDDAATEQPGRKAPAAPEEVAREEICYVTHLPPLSLQITLPEEYPERKPPVVDLITTPSWLARTITQRLAGEVVDLWEELGRSLVVFTFIDHLQQAAERVFDLTRDGVDPIRVDADILRALVDFDIKSKREKFERETFECGVCLSRLHSQTSTGRGDADLLKRPEKRVVMSSYVALWTCILHSVSTGLLQFLHHRRRCCLGEVSPPWLWQGWRCGQWDG